MTGPGDIVLNIRIDLDTLYMNGGLLFQHNISDDPVPVGLGMVTYTVGIDSHRNDHAVIDPDGDPVFPFFKQRGQIVLMWY